ncbi:pilus assembly protein PilO [Lamprobacter modestohalophilus]|uniref:Pilus assembly protein PilO n=1 Tax=Lamprobacter modestohalophilus TaxID=1064514 RepID=A0A9X1B4P2_9GAMM|nr:type 4a pilus biogenesis protein PilO [Lamprobacter modestohalophilus]MBK1619678.1 pilus assembly protein PilO [Lamprobacter modestohalophilus]MCF7976607.1 type 4a pilus biogenesis protein PilO [Chromatiaceae bacterium]MCF8014903.1 type 4a pilus biogenesis protein PilO [Chromatiaceae bacterium]
MDLNELDFNNISEWPLAAKVVLIVFGCGVIGFAWYHFITSGQIEQLERAEQKELELRQSFEQKQHKAANLEQYRQQLAEMEETFGAMLRQLPDETEVASLLVDVSQTGVAAGLEFELFQPSAEENKDFYAELPIRVRVRGRYHAFATFISGLAALPRIVTVHNIEIGGERRRGEPEAPMTLAAIVKTYRYLDEPEAQ